MVSRQSSQHSFNIQLQAGLSNRLRVLLSFIPFCQANTTQLLVYWPISSPCNGFFPQLFQPIQNVKFTQKQPKQIHYSLNKRCPNTTSDYNLLKPQPNIQTVIDQHIETLNKTFIAVHIRRTDLINHAKKCNVPITTDDEFIKFINEQPKEQRIYLATDNHETQRKFAELYKERIYMNILINPNTKGQRKTFLQDAVIDIFVCAKAKSFKGTNFSSFTDLIKDIRKIYEN